MWFQNIFTEEDDVKVITPGQLDDELNTRFKQSQAYEEIKKLERDIESKKTYINKLLDSFDKKIEDVETILHNFFQNFTIRHDYRVVLDDLQTQSKKAEKLEEQLNPHYFRHKGRISEFDTVMKKVREIDSLIANKIYKIKNTSLTDFLEAKKYQKKYFNTLEEQEQLEEEIDNLYRSRMEKMNKKQKYEKKLQKITNNPNYDELKDLEQDEKHKEDKLEKLDKELEELTKYLHIPKQAKKAFQDNKNIEILNKHKDSISDERFTKIQTKTNEYTNIMEDVTKIKKRLRGNSLILESKEQESFKQRVEEQIEELDKKLDKKKQRKDDLNPELYIQEMNTHLENHALEVISDQNLT